MSLTANLESSGTLDHDVPCPGPPALVQRFPGVPRSMSEPCDKPIPPAIPPFHSLPPSTPHADGHHILTPPAPGWFLKVTLDQDTRRMPFLCSGTPSFHAVLTGVCTPFHLTPFDPAVSPILSYRDLDGDTCTLTHTTYHDALPLFTATRIIRLSLAATHLAFTRPSTRSPDATPPGPEHLPSNTSRYSPPAHAVAGLSRDQFFLQESRRRDLDHAIAQWKSHHFDNPCSRSALHALREIFPNDSAGGLAVLRYLIPLGTLLAPVIRPPLSQFYHPLASVPSPGSGQLRKSYLPRNGFWETLACPGHLLRALEDTNKSGSGTLLSITGIRGLSMFKEGTPNWYPSNSFPLVSSPNTTPLSLTLVGFLSLDVVNASLPLLPPGSPPQIAGPLLLPSPPLQPYNTSLPTCHVSLPCLLTIRSCPTPLPPLPYPSTTPIH